MQTRLTGAALGLAAALTLLAPDAARAQRITDLNFLGQQNFVTGTTFNGTTVGGLSGLVYSGTANTYYAISDDRSPDARFYTLDINLSDGALNAGDVSFTTVTTLLQQNGQPFATNSLDPEGIALSLTAGNLFISSEGDRNNSFQPFVNEFNIASGQQVNALAVPAKFQIAPGVGVRNNLAFESLNRNGNLLVTATEAALLQDGPAPTLANGSPARILTYDAATGAPGAEFVYVVDPIPVAPNPAGGFADNGLVDLIALGGSEFLALERNFSAGVGNSIRLYQFSTDGATDVSGLQSLNGVPNVAPVQKTLLANLGAFGITPDNVEGVALGPVLPNGQRALILVSDNNFSGGQITQFLAFGVTQAAAPEPGTLALALGGLLTLGAARQRRRK